MTQEEETFSVRFSPFINEGNVIKMLEEFNRAELDIAGNAKITILIKR